MKLANILLPVDFSEQSIHAARYATALACRFHATLHIVHVLDLGLYGLAGLAEDGRAAGDVTSGFETFGEGELNAFLSAGLRSLNVRRTLLCGDPGREIVKYAHSEKIDLIVLPTHGYGPFRRFLLGSVTAKVLHDAECPVWTGVHMEGGPEVEPVGFGRILCAFNAWDGDTRALQWAWDFGQEAGSEVKIVHALPPVYEPGSTVCDEDTKQRMKSRADAAIAKAQQSAASHAAVEIVAGEMAAAICAAARDWNASLMVIGRGSASQFLGRLRSRSYEMIRESPCPVVSI